MAEPAKQAVGMPQLDFSTFPNQIFWLLVALAAIYLMLTRVALPQIGGVLADRRGAITADIAAAEEARQRAVIAEEIYQRALADARAEAGRIVEQARADMQRMLDLQIAKVEAEIAAQTAESEQRIREVRASAVEMVVEVARDTAKEVLAVFEVKADARAIRAAVDARMKQGDTR